METTLNREIIELVNSPGTIKILGTVDADGAPRLAVKESLRVNGQGLLEYDELIETSETNRNVLRALWFGGTVRALLVTPGGNSHWILARPVKTLVSGELFRKRYEAIRASGRDLDLGAVWILEPISFFENGLEKRRLEEEAKHPLLRHLDRLAVV
ncbi:MAG: hypothetical protein LBF38_06535 [Deltaproteobacteria bacterium]|jgi:hypothetical protein|nr:hypothetical protein [Deltaproteobacteria bacterium]